MTQQEFERERNFLITCLYNLYATQNIELISVQLLCENVSQNSIINSQPQLN